MNLTQFRALCQREWDKPARGDVIALTLTGPSRAELVTDAFTNPDQVCAPALPLIGKAGIPAITCGAGISELVNPITRSVVKIRTNEGGVRDSARVAVMGGTVRRVGIPASALPVAVDGERPGLGLQPLPGPRRMRDD